MDADFKKFGRGPRELTGAVDLISQYRLLPHLDFFCKRSLHVSISDTHYLHNVVGDTEISKGDSMELGQLIRDKFLPRESKTCIQPFDLDILRETFQLKEAAHVFLAASEKGTPIAGKSKASPKTRRRSIKSIRTKTRKRIKNIRSTNIVIKIRVKTRTGRRIKTGVGIMTRRESTMEMKMPVTSTNRRKVSTRVQRWRRWGR